MQRIFWLGNPFFQEQLLNLGWNQSGYANFSGMRLFGWDDIVSLAGFTPDILVVADKSLPPFVLGMEDFPCFTVLYCVDTHIHSWMPIYAQGFDACLISLRDHIQSFVSKFLPKERVWWSPPYAQDTDQPETDAIRLWDCLFVGSVTENTPGRRYFLEKLGQQIPGLHITRGVYRKLFPTGKVILNYCEHGDLNFRVFEAMGCGCCLLTPLVEHGLAELFTDGECLQTYKPDDVEDAKEKIKNLLNDEEQCQRMRVAAKSAIDSGHRASHRARAFCKKLQDLGDLREIVIKRRSKAKLICENILKICYLQWADAIPEDKIKGGYLAAANGLFQKWGA